MPDSGQVTNGRPGLSASAAAAMTVAQPSGGFSEWLDRHSRQLFITPAVVMILVFSIFPLVASLIIAFSRFRLRGGSYSVRFVGFQNFEKQLFGSEQFHFLGTFTTISVLGWVVALSVSAAILWWLVGYVRSAFTVVGFIGRLITASFAIGITFMFAATTLSGNPFGTLGVTLFYVFVGCSVQFLIGLGLAFLCSQPIWGRSLSLIHI